MVVGGPMLWLVISALWQAPIYVAGAMGVLAGLIVFFWRTNTNYSGNKNRHDPPMGAPDRIGGLERDYQPKVKSPPINPVGRRKVTPSNRDSASPGIKLTTAEMKFLASINLSEADVLMAEAGSREERRASAKRENKQLLIGSRCQKGGHRLRTWNHHCIQCSPAGLAFQGRWKMPGCVYIAVSEKTRRVKIGGAKSIARRESTLRNQSYGGASDWVMVGHVQVDEYGRVEAGAHKLLEKYWDADASYFKDGKQQSAIEVFTCSYSIARRALMRACSEANYIDPRSTLPKKHKFDG